MVAYYFSFKTALVKGSPNVVAPNTSVLIYDVLDVNRITPVAAYSDPALTTIVNLVSDAYGIVPDFYTNNLPDILWKSGTFKGQWATSQSRPGIRGATGPQGPQGIQGVQGNPGLNGAGTNAEVAAYIPSSGPTRDALDARYATGAQLAGKVSKGELVTNAADYGALDSTGTANASVTLQSALNATPDGGTLYIPPGTYRLNSTLASTGKTVHISAKGVKFVFYGTGVAVQIIGSWDATYAVSGIVAGSVTIDALAVPTVELTTTGAPTYKAGDVVKLVADDAIPGTRPASGGLVARVGQFLVVHSVAGGVVKCLSNGLIDPFTTNIRVAKLNHNTSTIDGLTATVDPSNLATSNAGLIQLSLLVNPVLKDVKIEQSGGQAINTVSCYGYTIDAATIGYANNDSAGSLYGYAIADNASSYGRVLGVNTRMVRHAYTTNTNQIAANSALFGYGRTYGAVISDSVAHSTSGASWDTHNDAQEVRFVNCASIDSAAAAFSLRGRKNSVVDCRAIRAGIGLSVFSEAGIDGDSWGHTIDGLVIDTPGTTAISVFLKRLSNTIDTRPTTMGNVRITDAPANSILFTNATVRIGKLDVTTRDFTTNADRLMVVNRSVVIIDTASFDLSAQASAAAGLLVGTMLNTATLKVADLKVTFGAQAVADKFAYLVDTSNATPGNTSNTLQVDKTVLDYYKAAAAYVIPYADSHADTYINYKALKPLTGGSSAYLYWSTSASSGAVAALSRTTESGIFFAGTITAATNLPTLRDGRYMGQTVYVCNLNGTGTLTVRHGAAYKVLTKSGADTTLAPGASMTIAWDGVNWRQIA